MGEHTTNIEEFLNRPGRIRRDADLFERWCREDPPNRNSDTFAAFKASSDWDSWSTNEINKMEEEATAARLLDVDVTRLKQRDPADATIPEPDRNFESDLTYFLSTLGVGKVPDFMLKDGSTAAVDRWNTLEKDCMGEVARNSTNLQDVWDVVYRAALGELKAEGTLTSQEISDLEGAMGGVWKGLGAWDTALSLKAMPDRKDLRQIMESRGTGTPGAWTRAFAQRHAAVFDKIDGQKSPTAKYKVLATFLAIEETQARKIRNRSAPATYSKMLDRCNEIPGRQPVPDDVKQRFNKSGYNFETPHKIWEELITNAKAVSYDGAKVESPEFLERFKKLNNMTAAGDFRPAINYQKCLDQLSGALEDWASVPVSWPASDTKFRAANRIAWNVEIMKGCIDTALYGASDGAGAIRERYHAVLDGAVERITNELQAIK